MKQLKYIFLLASISVLASCSDELIQKIDVEKNHGKDVSFSAFAEADDVDTRTYYGQENTENNTYPIYWASDDRIVVGSPMAEVSTDPKHGYKTAVYDITVPDNYQSTGASYAKSIDLNTDVNTEGVRWSTDPTGSFYAIYPYSAQTRRRPGDQYAKEFPRYHNQLHIPKDGTSNPTMGLMVENIQRIWAPSSTAATNGILNMYGSNHSLPMWAQTDNVKNGESVNLRFKPISTCLIITLENSTSAKSATIENIKIISSKTNEYISGRFEMTFPNKSATANEQTINMGTPTNYTLKTDSCYNYVQIIPWIKSPTSDKIETGMHPIIPAGGKMQVCAFFLPQDYTLTSDWKIQIKLNGEYTIERSLVDKQTTMKAGMIQKISLPAFGVNKEWTYTASKWMESLDDKTYLTQITFPGTWYSYCRDQENPENYQQTGWNLAKQLSEGVRAFDLSTRTGSDSDATDAIPTGIVISGTGSGNGDGSTNSSTGYTGGTPLANAIKAIAATFRNTKETGVVVISQESGGNGGHRPIDMSYWLYGVCNVINTQLTEVEDCIYGFGEGEKITAESVLGDVRGKIILKINIDNDVLNNLSETYPYESTPAMISFSPTKWLSDFEDSATGQKIENLDGVSLTSNLEWGSQWENTYKNIILTGTPEYRKGVFAWNFSCTNRTQINPPTSGSNNLWGVGSQPGLPTYAQRKSALETLITEISLVYNEGYHDEWFLFGVGGTQAYQLNGNGDGTYTNIFGVNTPNQTSSPSPTYFAQEMNPWLLGKIKGFFDNNTPCPLGIVFFNQVGNPTYNGQEILDLLIKMNGAFYLQQNPNWVKPGTTPASVTSVSTDHSSGVIKDANWEVI